MKFELIDHDTELWKREDGYWYIVGGRHLDPATLFDDPSVQFDRTDHPSVIGDRTGLLGWVKGDDIRLNERAVEMLKEKYDFPEQESPKVIMEEQPIRFDPDEDELLIRVNREHGQQSVYLKPDDRNRIYEIKDEIHIDSKKLNILSNEEVEALLRQRSALNVVYIDEEKLSNLGFDV